MVFMTSSTSPDESVHSRRRLLPAVIAVALVLALILSAVAVVHWSTTTLARVDASAAAVHEADDSIHSLVSDRVDAVDAVVDAAVADDNVSAVTVEELVRAKASASAADADASSSALAAAADSAPDLKGLKELSSSSAEFGKKLSAAVSAREDAAADYKESTRSLPELLLLGMRRYVVDADAL